MKLEMSVMKGVAENIEEENIVLEGLEKYPRLDSMPIIYINLSLWSG